MPGGILLFGVQRGHDGLPPAGRSALVAAVDRGWLPTDWRDVHGTSMPVVVVSDGDGACLSENIDLIDKIFF
jgi:hypothetical protein